MTSFVKDMLNKKITNDQKREDYSSFFEISLCHTWYFSLRLLIFYSPLRNVARQPKDRDGCNFRILLRWSLSSWWRHLDCLYLGLVRKMTWTNGLREWESRQGTKRYGKRVNSTFTSSKVAVELKQIGCEHPCHHRPVAAVCFLESEMRINHI